MQQKLMAAERAIVDVDVDPLQYAGGRREARRRVLTLANMLSDIKGIYLKGESALDACGYELIEDVHKHGVRMMADTKLFGTTRTLTHKGALLREAKPEIVTVACSVGVTAMRALKAQLPDTEVLGIPFPTHLGEADAWGMHGLSLADTVKYGAGLAVKAGLDGVVTSGKDVRMLREEFGSALSITVVAIRQKGVPVPGDDQNPERVTTLEEALEVGGDRFVLGRVVTGSKKPYAATMRLLELIHAARG